MDWRFDGLTALVSIAAGKAADLVVLAGNRAKKELVAGGVHLIIARGERALGSAAVQVAGVARSRMNARPLEGRSCRWRRALSDFGLR